MKLMSTLAFVVCLLSIYGTFATEGEGDKCEAGEYRSTGAGAYSDSILTRKLRSDDGGCKECEDGSYRTDDMDDDHCESCATGRFSSLTPGSSPCSCNGKKWCRNSGCCDGTSDDYYCDDEKKCAPVPPCSDQLAAPVTLTNFKIEGTCQDLQPSPLDGNGDTVVYAPIGPLFAITCPLPSPLICTVGSNFTLFKQQCKCAAGNVPVPCTGGVLVQRQLCVTPPSEPGGPGVNGDPHFTGFDGSKFDFKGTNGDVYNILSHNNHQVNARFGTIADINGTDNGLWLMGLGVRHCNMNFSISIDMPQDFVPEVWMDPESVHATHMRMRIPEDKKWLSLTLNGNDISEGLWSGSYSPLKAGALIYFPDHTQKNKNDKYDGPIAVLRTGDIQFTFYVETEDVIHLDVSTEILSKNITSMHGVLGQTFHWVNAQIITRQIEGSDQDYLVKDGLLGTDFTFNQFKGKGGQGKHMGRRLSVPESSSGLFAASGGNKARVSIPDITM